MNSRPRVTTTSILIASLFGLISPDPAWTGTSSHRQNNQSVSHGNVLVRFENFTTSLKGAARSGMNKWNHPNCIGSDGEAPFLTENVGAGDPPGHYIGLTMTLVDGFNPDNNRRCGDRFGSQVHIYKKAKDPDGDTFFCTRLDIFEDVVQHEIGHFQGLKDGCQGVMSFVSFRQDGTYINRNLAGAECSLVKSTHYTPAEELEDECAQGNQQSCEDLNPCEYPDNANCSPVVLDLAGRGFAFSDPERGVMFDIDADGFPERTSWTQDARRSRNAFLAIDRNRNVAFAFVAAEHVILNVDHHRIYQDLSTSGVLDILLGKMAWTALVIVVIAALAVLLVDRFLGGKIKGVLGLSPMIMVGSFAMAFCAPLGFLLVSRSVISVQELAFRTSGFVAPSRKISIFLVVAPCQRHEIPNSLFYGTSRTRH